MRSRGLIAVSMIGAVLAVGTAAGQTLRADEFILVNDAGFSPKELPRTENAPLTLHDAFKISVLSGGAPPIINSITYLFDRHGEVDVSGLPVCSWQRLQGTDVQAARRVCADAIVGRGTATALIDLPEQEPFSASAPLTLFNGPSADRNPVVLAHAFARQPVPTTFIVPVVVERVHRGVYGFRVKATIPAISGGYGHLDALSFKVGRTWRYRGQLHSYVKGRCETGHLNARAEFAFQDGNFLAGSVSPPCIARGR